MLTIKKRFPFNKLYIAGSAAIIAGYGGIMMLAGYLPQPYTGEQLAAASQSQPVKTVEKETTAASTTESDEASTNSTSQPWVAPTVTTMPTSTTPAAETPTTPVVVDPIPEVPVVETPVEEEPVDPIGDLLDGVGDLLTP